MQSSSSSDPQTDSDWPVDPRLLMQNAPSGVLVVDSSGVIRMANHQVRAMFGYEPEELIGGTVEVLVPERFRDVHLGHREGYHRNPTMRPMGLGLSLLARRKDGSEFPVEISLSPIATASGEFVMAAIRDITDRRELEEERNLLSIELETERERQRIGMDLHDGIMQEVYAVGLGLELALEDLDDSPSDARHGIERAIDELHNVIRNIRSYIFDLRPRELSGSLSRALQDLAREFGENSQIATTAEIEGALPELDDERAMTLYHIAHEALSNIQKHAHAEHVEIILRKADTSVALEVRDDGRGFDTSVEISAKHRGMRNMATRARTAGGDLRVESAPGAGTSIHVSMPQPGA